MVQQNRSKEVWLIPKRGSLHQTICLIESLVMRGYDQTRWNEQKQNNVGNDLRKRGAVKFKRSPSNQSVRTLLASVPQYFGFLYIDNSTTPNTVKLTEAGKRLYDFHKKQITNIGTLSEGKINGNLIESSPIILEQFEKLQITNPIILKDCENILVFPFRAVLKLLLQLDYLDREELACFVFSMRAEDEIPLVVDRIKKFRKQDKMDRDREIGIFKKTHIGNITLVKASSAAYFESLCFNTGIINKTKIKKPNPGYTASNTISAINIKSTQKSYVIDMLNNKYKDAEVYDFGNRLRLWIDYIGNPERLLPPRDIELINSSDNSLIMIVEQNGIMLLGDLVESQDSLIAPMFLEENYDVVLISPIDGKTINRVTVTPDFKEHSYQFAATITGSKGVNLKDLGIKIIDHSVSKSFDKNYLIYLGIVEKIIGNDLVNNKNLRGAYFEYLFYKFLEMLIDEGIIEDVYWNGTLVGFGLPRPAPGGRTGTPDIVFKMKEEFFVLELTTIKAKSTQFSAEGSSVPDHIKIFAEDNPGVIVNGIFSAPVIHSRNTSAMKSILNPLNINLKCIPTEELVNLFLSKDSEHIFKELKKD